MRLEDGGKLSIGLSERRGKALRPFDTPAPAGLHPQVGALEAVVGGEVAGGAGKDEAAVFQDAGAVGHGQT